MVTAVIALAALSACGSSGGAGKDGGAQVATLTTPEAGPGPSTGPATSERPRERLDTTPEEYEAMLVPYEKCLSKSGITRTKSKAAADAAQLKEASGPKAEKDAAAARKCEERYLPLPPWEKDPANPEARDFARAVVTCLKQKGVTYVEVSEDGLSPAFGGPQNDSRSISMGMELAPGCEREVAAK